MGLTIHYTLALPPDTPALVVTNRVGRLRATALRIGFAQVGPLVRTTAGQSLAEAFGPRDALAHWFRFSAAMHLDERDPITGGLTDALPEAVGFTVHPGRGSEAATFGVARVPPADAPRTPARGVHLVWHWRSACKTQYASAVGKEHFVRCHTSLVSLLEAARRLGFRVTVLDEGGYWETRDSSRLVAEVERMNRIMARFAGAVHDAIGDAVRVEGPIFEHPEFERLETSPASLRP